MKPLAVISLGLTLSGCNRICDEKVVADCRPSLALVVNGRPLVVPENGWQTSGDSDDVELAVNLPEAPGQVEIAATLADEGGSVTINGERQSTMTLPWAAPVTTATIVVFSAQGEPTRAVQVHVRARQRFSLTRPPGFQNVTSVALSADGETLVTSTATFKTGSTEGLFSAQRLSGALSILGPSDTHGRSVSVSDDGSVAAAAAQPSVLGSTRVWRNDASGWRAEPVRTPDGGTPSRVVALAGDGRTAWSMVDNGLAGFVAADGGWHQAVVLPLDCGLIAVSTDSSVVACGGDPDNIANQTVVIATRPLLDGPQAALLFVNQGAPVSALALSGDGRVLAIASNAGADLSGVNIYEAVDGRYDRRFTLRPPIGRVWPSVSRLHAVAPVLQRVSVTVSRDGETVIAGFSGENSVAVAQRVDGAWLFTEVVLGVDARIIASDGWSASFGTGPRPQKPPVGTFAGARFGFAVGLSADGRRLVVSAPDDGLFVFEAP